MGGISEPLDQGVKYNTEKQVSLVMYFKLKGLFPSSFPLQLSFRLMKPSQMMYSLFHL